MSPAASETVVLSARVAAAFGVPREAHLLAGGFDRNTYRSGHVVLRRLGPDAVAEATWTAELFDRLHRLRSPDFRVPRPLRGAGGSWIVDGWTAETFLEGRAARRSDAPALVAAIQAFHAAIAHEPYPDFRRKPVRPPNPWDRADGWAWGELPVPVDPRLVAPLTRLARVRRPLPPLREQLIHGDLNPDNTLIAPGEPPAIIDMTPYWRPAGFAAAVAAYWLGPYRGDEHVLAHFEGVPHFDQLLVRAALRMLLTFRDLSDVGDVDQYAPAIDIICRRLSA